MFTTLKFAILQGVCKFNCMAFAAMNQQYKHYTICWEIVLTNGWAGPNSFQFDSWFAQLLVTNQCYKTSFLDFQLFTILVGRWPLTNGLRDYLTFFPGQLKDLLGTDSHTDSDTCNQTLTSKILKKAFKNPTNNYTIMIIFGQY